MGRAVAIIADPPSLAQLCAESLMAADGGAGPFGHPLIGRYVQALRRDGQRRIRWRERYGHSLLRTTVVHTTSTDALPGIVEAGALKCAALLGGGDRSSRIGAVLFDEPDDYAEYVSRRLGHFYDREDDDYIPGVRMYFSRHRDAAQLCESLGVPVLRPRADAAQEHVAQSNKLFVRRIHRLPWLLHGA